MYFCQELMELEGLNSIAFSDDDDQVAETGSHNLMELCARMELVGLNPITFSNDDDLAGRRISVLAS